MSEKIWVVTGNIENIKIAIENNAWGCNNKSKGHGIVNKSKEDEFVLLRTKKCERNHKGIVAIAKIAGQMFEEESYWDDDSYKYIIPLKDIIKLEQIGLELDKFLLNEGKNHKISNQIYLVGKIGIEKNWIEETYSKIKEIFDNNEKEEPLDIDEEPFDIDEEPFDIDEEPFDIDEEPKNEGFIYIMQMDGLDGFKVGKSIDPTGRAKSLRTGSPNPVRVRVRYKTIDMNKSEKLIHKSLNTYRMKNGGGTEFFDCDEDYIRKICSIVTEFVNLNI